MATGLRPKLGLMLQDVMGMPSPAPVMPGKGQMLGQQMAPPPMPPAPPSAPPAAPPAGHGFFHDGGLGQILAGAIGDGLLQHAGMQPVYAPMQRQRAQAAAEEAVWSRHHATEQQDQMALLDYKRLHPEQAPIARDVAAYSALDDAGKAAYHQMHPGPDQTITMTLPNGQVFSGQKADLPEWLSRMGASGGAPQPPAPLRPVGRLTPITGGTAGKPASPFVR